MTFNTADLRIREVKELLSPTQLWSELPCTDRAAATTIGARRAIHSILQSTDDRLLVVIGPCSIHDPVAAMEYAARLSAERERG